MKVNSIGVIPPAIPSARTARPSFGHDIEDEPMDRDVDTLDRFEEEGRKPRYMDEWKRGKREFEEYSNDPETPSAMKKISNIFVLAFSGLITYGTTKFGLEKAVGLIADKMKSDTVTKATSKVGEFVKDTVAPQAKKAADFVADSKIGTAVKDKYQKMASKEGVAKKLDFIANKKAQLKEWLTKLKSKETKAKIQDGIIKTLSVGSGIAGAVTGEKLAIEHRHMDGAA